MIRADAIKLITQPTHGVFDTPEETAREVFCNVRSVGLTEYYRAREFNLSPEYVFVLADPAEYQDEKVCEWNGVRYDVIRVYSDGLRVELTVEEAKTNA